MALRGSVSRRYAEGVFAIAKDHSSFDRWLEDIGTIKSVFTDPTMKRFLDDPKSGQADQERVIRKLLDGKVDPLAINLAVLLIRREHTGTVEGLERELKRMVNDYRNVAEAEVTTAIDLDGEQRELVKQRLQVLTHKDIELQTRVDVSILGGFVARVGDTLIDASLKTKLARLRQDLLAHT